MTQQSDRQASVRSVTGTAGTYEGDWHALFDQLGLPTGDFNGRFLRWLNLELAGAYASLPEAMGTYAAMVGAGNWASVGTLAILNNNAVSLASGDLAATDAGDVLITG